MGSCSFSPVYTHKLFDLQEWTSDCGKDQAPSLSVQLCSWCFLCPCLCLSPCLASLLLHWEWDRDQYLTQRLLISLVVHNSGSLSLCPVNEDADVIELPTPHLLCTVGTFPPLSQGSVLLLHFLWSCITVQRSSCVASSISSSPGGMVTVGNSGPENWPSFQYSRKTPQRRTSWGLFDLCWSRMKHCFRQRPTLLNDRSHNQNQMWLQNIARISQNIDLLQCEGVFLKEGKAI